MYIVNVELEMKDCIFRNFFTYKFGGLFYVESLYNFSIDGIEIYNTTSINGVYRIYLL